MKTVAEIQQAILELHEADYAQLSRWFQELDWQRRDTEIEQDSRDGKLDFLFGAGCPSQGRRHVARTLMNRAITGFGNAAGESGRIVDAGDVLRTGVTSP